MELRAASTEDRAFLRDVYGSTREQELADVPWSAEQKIAFLDHQFDAQDTYYKGHYEGATYDVILVDGTPAGRLYVARWPEEIRIMDIALLPAFRGQGVGTRLMRDILEEGTREGKSVTIHVEVNNPAMTLYRRLGFEQRKERHPYVLMEWSPTAASS